MFTRNLRGDDDMKDREKREGRNNQGGERWIDRGGVGAGRCWSLVLRDSRPRPAPLWPLKSSRASVHAWNKNNEAEQSDPQTPEQLSDGPVEVGDGSGWRQACLAKLRWRPCTKRHNNGARLCAFTPVCCNAPACPWLSPMSQVKNQPFTAG